MGGEAGLYYALNPDYALCGYRGAPYLLYHRRVGTFSAVSKADAELLMGCDGAVDLQTSPALERLCACRILKTAPEPLTVDDAQRYAYYDNRFFRTATWAITAGCNLNCRHCFVAKDANRTADRFSLEEARKLIGEMKACGIREVHLTGGEPLVHPEIDEIIAELSRNDLKIARMVTNGLLVDDAFLRRLKALGQDPLFTVSFDGLGTHEWLRNAKGIERKTLDQIDRIRDAGFDVSVQMSLYRGNVDVVWDTIKYFETRGVLHMRFMRTSEAPRWLERYEDQTLTPDEYCAFGLDLIEKYAEQQGPLTLCMWQLLWYHCRGGRVSISPMHHAGESSDGWTACQDAHDNFFIGATGEVAPCMPVSGTLLMRGVSLGNVKETPLQTLLSDSKLTEWTLLTLKDLYRANAKCRECPYRDACCGGCRALAYGLTGDLYGSDPLRCAYFYGGYYDRVNALVRRYT